MVELIVDDEWACGEVKGSFFMSGKLLGEDRLVMVISTDLTKTTWHVSGCRVVSNARAKTRWGMLWLPPYY